MVARLRLVLLVWQMLLAIPACAQTVSVSATRDPEWRRYPAFAAGLAAFEKHRNLAPGATLQFQLFPVAGQRMPTRVRIAGEDQMEVVQVDAQGRFVLPSLAWAIEQNAELLLDAPRASVRWRPLILSEGVPPGHRRLGDLRLECEVRWAVEEFDVPSLMRMVFNASGGPCHSSDVKVPILSNQPLSRASFIHHSGRKAQTLEVSADGMAFVAPLADQRIPNDNLIRLEACLPEPTH